MSKKTPNYELLKEAYSIIDGIPGKLIDLDHIVKQKGERLDCGTICCAAGWLAHHPKFQALGLEMAHDKNDGDNYEVKYRSERGYRSAMSALFGVSGGDAVNLFGSAGVSDYGYTASGDSRVRGFSASRA